MLLYAATHHHGTVQIMRIAIATPFFPPDVEVPASYVKTLAGTLQKEHEVTVILYGHLPEAVDGVHMLPVDKRRHILPRLIAYTQALWHASKEVDVIYAENGPSVELPIVLISFFSKVPYILHEGDPRARTRIMPWYHVRTILARIARRRAYTVLDEQLPERPEILPFAPYPKDALTTYESIWQTHTQHITSTLHHATIR